MLSRMISCTIQSAIVIPARFSVGDVIFLTNLIDEDHKHVQIFLEISEEHRRLLGIVCTENKVSFAYRMPSIEIASYQ